MGAIRIILNKSWRHPKLNKLYTVATVLQCDAILASELLADKIGVLYTGEYPPKGKIKMDLKQLKTK